MRLAGYGRLCDVDAELLRKRRLADAGRLFDFADIEFSGSQYLDDPEP